MLIQEEVWKDIKGLEGYYQVSNKGRVKSVPRVIIKTNGYQARISEKMLKPSKDKTTGQLTSVFSKDGKVVVKSYKSLLTSHFGANYEVVDITVTYEIKEGEVFRDAKGYEGLYEVSNYGTVRSKERSVYRKDGAVRYVSSKILADRNRCSVCLSKPINGVKSAHSHSIAQLMVESFHKDFNYGIHVIKKIKSDGRFIDQYQYFTRLQFNPVTVRLKTGEYFSFNNYKKLAEYLTALGLKVSTHRESFKKFFFKEVHCVKYKQFDGMTIAFTNPVFYQDDIKLVKVFTTGIPRVKPQMVKRKYKRKNNARTSPSHTTMST